MTTLIEQYRAGNCESVWRTIVDEHRQATDIDAQAVALETVFRARDSFHAIYERLIQIGYEFAEPADAFAVTTPDEANAEIAVTEAEYGALPEIVRLWYSYVRSVNFSQSVAQCKDPEHPLRNLGWFQLALFLPLKKCRELGARQSAEYREWYAELLSGDLDAEYAQDCLSRCKSPDEMARFLPLGSSASNNDPKGFALPCDLIDAEFYNDGEPTYFNEELRDVIRAGCFRMLSQGYREALPRFMQLGYPDPDALLAFLTRDLMPL